MTIFFFESFWIIHPKLSLLIHSPLVWESNSVLGRRHNRSPNIMENSRKVFQFSRPSCPLCRMADIFQRQFSQFVYRIWNHGFVLYAQFGTKMAQTCQSDFKERLSFSLNQGWLKGVSLRGKHPWCTISALFLLIAPHKWTTPRSSVRTPREGAHQGVRRLTALSCEPLLL